MFRCFIQFDIITSYTLQPLSNVEWNGEPRGYRVLYKVTSDDRFIATTPEDSLTIHKTHLLGLREGLQYEVKLVAFNDVGEGPFSPLMMVKLGKYEP